MQMSHPRRRHALRWLALAAAGATVPAWAQQRPEPAAVEVWKDVSCGCCQDWITHMQQNGFKVTAHDTGNHAVRARLGLATKYGSCHTALVGGYVVEGHVHADDVRRLLRETPVALGLAVPGMPVGSPGMDGPEYRGRRDRYDTLLVLRDGGNRVFRSHS
ncbi:DUF411 domain-containing protein [Ottowia sp.]|uniref:DUF411 domain-containing protein n=1 Tax=Ottowia sp. TaxID=1898956 RepID=UPI002CBEBC75|nr:DUF411 domain-containing protein [Ottowia sp.]HOB65634.1 DUF411 domain-containing protein [Ottowia sp.]HPZ56375.1 DUF411 domain-containing protein [Ottowia sp.]HQD46912.1 DUF411 domain-containing protein [Ottowia sp.]